MKQLLITLITIFIFTCNKLHSQELIPKIHYSTYYGGIGIDDADAVTVDAAGNIYLGCHSNSTELPGTNKHSYTPGGGMDAFIVKLNPKGKKVDYLTHLGGSKWDAIQGLTSDTEGNIYAIGTTYSSDFPIDSNGFQSKSGGKSDAFVIKLNVEGKVVWSTFLGGSQDEDGRNIVIGQDGNIHVIGRTESKDFPIIAGALQSQLAGGIDVFVATLNPDGKVLATTYLGGSGNDIGFSIELDDMGRRYIGGTTNSLDFPVHNAIQEVNHGENDLFIVMIDSTGSSLEFASYLGGKGTDQIYNVNLGPLGDVFIMGVTTSSDFPTTQGVFQPEFKGERDAIITRLNVKDRNIVYSTYLGGKNAETLRNLVVDKKGNAFITGQTSSKDFPTVNSFQPKLRGRSDAFMTMLNPSGTSLIYSTLFGGKGTEIFEGAAIGTDGSITVSGLSSSKDFPLVNPLQNTYSGGRFDIVVTRFVLDERE
ncbi:hypothetical protein GTQ40_11010 [Flavobacteriaceae bacterium R38]|nr:hypothetical protein [Flavobacteriaceae bacterium R38]